MSKRKTVTNTPLEVVTTEATETEVVTTEEATTTSDETTDAEATDAEATDEELETVETSTETEATTTEAEATDAEATETEATVIVDRTTMTMKEIFDLVEEVEGHTFKEKVLYDPKMSIKIEDEFGILREIKGMIVKEDQLVEITTETGDVLKVGTSHHIRSNFVKIVANLTTDDILINNKGEHVAITDIKFTGETIRVYDIALDTDSHLYSDADGYVHHNTFECRRVLETYGLKDGTHYFSNTGKLSASALYEELYWARDGRIQLFDDADGFLADEDAVNLLKGAVGPDGKITWKSKGGGKFDARQITPDMEEYQAEIDKGKFPDFFFFHGKIIIISNKPSSWFTKDENRKAILSRSFPIDITMAASEVLTRIRKLYNSGAYSEELFSRDVQTSAMKYITEIVEENPNIKTVLTLRTYEQVCKLHAVSRQMTPQQFKRKIMMFCFVETN